jgi:hypothetical protein
LKKSQLNCYNKKSEFGPNPQTASLAKIRTSKPQIRHCGLDSLLLLLNHLPPDITSGQRLKQFFNRFCKINDTKNTVNRAPLEPTGEVFAGVGVWVAILAPSPSQLFALILPCSH